jgi:hypothetical protein
VTHGKISEHRARRNAWLIASLLGASSCGLGACNVYDSSLLEHDSLNVAGSDQGGASNLGGNANANGGTFAGTSSSDGGRSGDGATSGGSDEQGGNGASGANSAGSSSAGTNAGAGASASAGSSSGGASGSTGAAGSGTVAGSGGSGTVGGSAAGGALNASLSVIDDMENPDQYIPDTDGRQGFWSLSNDGSGGTQTPSIMTMSAIPGGRGTSMYALHTTSMGFTKTGALVGVDLNRKTARSTYDASAYQAVHFYAKVAPGSLALVHFAMPDMHTDPAGDLCTKAPQQCYDHWATDRTFSNDWAEYTIAFSDLDQFGWGDNDATALDVAHVYGIQFSWGTQSMDLWIDDIAFVKK